MELMWLIPQTTTSERILPRGKYRYRAP